jgi:hypothetical protein
MPDTTADVEVRASIIRAKAEEYHLTVTAHDQIVSVYGNFTPGDKAAYVTIENRANEILRMFRQVRNGSVWGTDSGSVGGALALGKGKFLLNKSGCEKRLASKFYQEVR